MQKELNQKNRSDFIVFQNNKHLILKPSYDDPVIFYIINTGYILNNRDEEFKKFISEFIKFDDKIKKFEFDERKSKTFFDILIRQKVLSGLNIGALGKNAGLYLRLFERMGARTRQINLGNEPLKYLEEETYDITFSSSHFDSEVMKKYDMKNPKMFAFQNYALLSSLTKMGGFSINSNGNYITTLYDLFFQLIGFKIKEYFRSQNSDKGFTIILEKINNKTVSQNEFNYLFQEIKKRNPIRYF